MTDYHLLEDIYVRPTPAGAYHAVCNSGTDKSRAIIRHLLKQAESPKADRGFIDELSAHTGIGEPEVLLHQLQSIRYLDGSDHKIVEPGGVIEQMVEECIAPLSTLGKAMLADDQGFYIAAAGLAHETAGELAALAAQLGEVYERRRPVLNENLRLDTAAMALVDASGTSEIGFWPLYIGSTRFSLVVQGLPRFDQPAFVQLAWMLTRRYAIDAVPGQQTKHPSTQ
jgi:hypothetical protein